MDKSLAIIIGSRPQYIKFAPFLFYLKKTKISYFTIDTNQHYDNELSKVLIKELNIDKFNYNLNVKEKYHGKMTAIMMIKIEKILVRKKPKMVVVFGDTNTTLASSLISASFSRATLRPSLFKLLPASDENKRFIASLALFSVTDSEISLISNSALSFLFFRHFEYRVLQ